MILKIKKFIVTGLASFMLFAPALAMTPALGGGVASADIKGSLCEGADAAAGSAAGTTCANTQGGDKGIKDLATKITNWFSIIVGAIAIIMIIYGGFRYITSGGDSGRVGSAKNTLIYAIVGLIIVALAQVIVRFVVDTAGDTTTNF